MSIKGIRLLGSSLSIDFKRSTVSYETFWYPVKLILSN